MTKDRPQPGNTSRLPVDNAPLQQAIAALRAEDTPAHFDAVITALLSATLLTPVTFAPGTKLPAPDAHGRVGIPKDARFAFTLLTDQQKNRYFMLFTGPEALKRWKKDVLPPTFLLRFDDLAALLRREGTVAGAVIDPFSTPLRLPRKLVETILLKGTAQRPPVADIRPGDNVTLVEPSVCPDALLDALCAALAQAPDVRQAYLLLMIRNGGEPSYLLIVDGKIEHTDVERVTQAAQPFLQTKGKGRGFSIVPSFTPLGHQGRKDTDPFYRRGEGRLPSTEE